MMHSIWTNFICLFLSAIVKEMDGQKHPIRCQNTFSMLQTIIIIIFYFFIDVTHTYWVLHPQSHRALQGKELPVELEFIGTEY